MVYGSFFYGLRRRPRERNQRLFEGHSEVVHRIVPRIIARYDRKSENEGSNSGCPLAKRLKS